MVRRRYRRRRRRRQKKAVSSAKPLIGITCEVHKIKPFFSEFELFCDYRYVRAIMRAGGIPIMIPISPYRRDVAKIVGTIDGLLIVGGDDIHPSFYRERATKKVDPIYRGRTYFEMELFRAAQKRGIPILGICYGMQLVNVVYGGSLYQDIKTKVVTTIRHRSKRRPMHRVDVVRGSLIHRIFKKESFEVHSDHHQAIRVPGEAIKISAFSRDGIAEAAEGPPNTIVVQWHPERQPKDRVQMRLFRYFLRQARRHKISGER